MTSRIDPYWDGLWAHEGGVVWSPGDLVRQQCIATPEDLPKALRISQADAIDLWFSRRDIASRVALLGAVFSWRTLTVQQVAYVLDDERLLSTNNQTLALSWAAGLIDIGRWAKTTRAGSLLGADALIRPGKVFNDPKFVERLTWAEWMTITGGLPWTRSIRRDQHDVLAAEIGLRLAERAPIGTVLGEKFSTIDLLVGTGLNPEKPSKSKAGGDLCVVRDDGLRIVIELTRSVNDDFLKKISRWVRRLGDLNDRGLLVVFVVTEHDVLKRVKDAVHAAVWDPHLRGSRYEPKQAESRVGVVYFEEWFPVRHAMSAAAASMTAWFPTNPLDAADWSARPLLDQSAVPFAPTFHATAVLDGSCHLAQTPKVTRDLLTDILRPEPLRPAHESIVTDLLGQDAGHAPARLLGLVDRRHEDRQREAKRLRSAAA